MRSYRVPGYCILSGILAGFLRSVTRGGVSGFFWKMLLVLALAFPLYALGMMGAGDCKLMALIAGWMGFLDGGRAIAIGLCLGAVLALVKLLRQGSIYQRFLFLTAYIGRVIREKTAEKYYVKERDARTCVIPLGACFCLGAVIVSLLNRAG